MLPRSCAGGNGADTVFGGRGGDFVFGGPGNDTCRGGPGNNDTATNCENAISIP